MAMGTRAAIAILLLAAASAAALGAVSISPSRPAAKSPAATPVGTAPSAPGAPGTAATPAAAPTAATSSPGELLARVKADALKGKLTDALIIEFKEFAAAMAWQKLKAPAGVSAEFWTWLSANKDLRDPLVVILFPKFDPEVFRALETLKVKYGDHVKNYHHLALAMALVYGRAGAKGVRGRDVRFANAGREVPSIEDSFGWYLKYERAMKMPLKTTPWPILLYVADNDLPLEERGWALQRYGNTPPGAFGKIYYDIAYNDSLINAAKDDTAWTLATILAKGGICMHRAYYASRVLKSFGVPSIYVGGEGERGGHAWVAWVGRERESIGLLSSGRFDYDRYYTGVMFDPLVQRETLDRDLELKALAVARSYPGWLDAAVAYYIAQIIQEEDVAKALAILEGAVQRNPYCDMPWRLVALWCSKGVVSQELGEKMYDAMYKSFANYPDLMFEVLSKILQPRMKPDSKPTDAEVARNLQLLDKAFAMYEAAKRPDLSVRLRAFQGQYTEAVGRRDDALKGYVLCSEKYANQHYGFVVLFDRAVKIMQEDKKQDMMLKYMAMMAAKVPEYQEDFNRKYDLKNTAWVHVVNAYVEALRAAGRAADADTWQAKLPKPKK
ncbi:MAG: hypothetical protein NTY65_17455 [Planctomycetota bacterium]|nr:hypothetical protein [Planctomycetota bacterium]